MHVPSDGVSGGELQRPRRAVHAYLCWRESKIGTNIQIDINKSYLSTNLKWILYLSVLTSAYWPALSVYFTRVVPRRPPSFRGQGTTAVHKPINATMSGYDANRIFSVAVHNAPPAQNLDKPAEVERMLLDFLLQYRVGGEFSYR